MGQRSSTETVVAILQALIKSRKCTQAELARRAGLEGAKASQVVRKHLNELVTNGFPIESYEEHPHVYWTVPHGWFPGAVIFERERVPQLLRQLSRLPRSKVRDGLIRQILEAAPRPSPTPPGVPTVLTPQRTEREEDHLTRVEEAAMDKATLELKYLTTGHDKASWRHVSVQSVLPGPPARFIAFCHKDQALKWFRLDNVERVLPDKTVPFHVADPARVEAMLKQSVDGYHQGDAVRCAFFVSDPEASWVAHNLPVSMSPEPVQGGVRFVVTTAGVLRLARFVVGLGAAARAETPELAEQVRELARGALEGHGS